jgi:hypothetical protein
MRSTNTLASRVWLGLPPSQICTQQGQEKHSQRRNALYHIQGSTLLTGTVYCLPSWLSSCTIAQTCCQHMPYRAGQQAGDTVRTDE